MNVTGTTCFSKCFLFHVITERQFFIKVPYYPSVLFNCHVLAFFETNDLKVCILYFFYPEQLSTVNNKVPNELLVYHEALIYLSFLLPHFFTIKCFEKNLENLWKHVFFLPQEALFISSFVKLKSHST